MVLVMPTCFSCNNSNIFSKIDEKVTEHDFTLKLIKCEKCSLIFLEEPPSSDLLSKMYTDDTFYDNSTKSDEEEINARNGILEYGIESAIRDSGKLLDAGCAKGHLLVAASRKGWDAYGIEYNKHYVDYGNTKLGTKISQGELMNVLESMKQKFDVIILWHTLHNVVQPRELLMKLKEKLSPNGIIALQVPDYEKLGNSIVGAHHISYFTRESMINLIENSGLKLLSYDYDNTNKFISVRLRN